jgi:hypothetical protein
MANDTIALADTRSGLRRLSTLLAAVSERLTGQDDNALIADAILSAARDEIACLLGENRG